MDNEEKQLLKFIANKIESIDNRLTSLENKVDAMDKRLTSVENRLTSVESKVDAMDKRLTSVELNQENTISHQLAILSENHINLNNKLDKFLDKMNEQESIKLRLHIVENKVEELSK